MKKNSLIKITLTNLVLMFSFVAVFAQPDTALDYHLKLLDKYPIFMSYCDSSTSSNFIEYCFSEEVDSIIDFKASQAIGQSILLIIKPGIKWEYNIIEIWYRNELVGDSELSFKLGQVNHTYVSTSHGIYPIISEFDWLYSNFKVLLVQIRPNTIKVSLNGSLYIDKVD